MKEWPFWGGVIAQFLALGRFVDRLTSYLGRVIGNLLVIATFLVILSSVLHHAGAPVPDLLPFLPSLGSLGK